MKKLDLSVIVASLCLLSALPAEAARHNNSDTVVVSHSSSDRGAGRYGLGFTTFQTGNDNLGFSALFDLTSANSIQLFFGVSGTSPFGIGFGGAFKSTVIGNQNSGIHIGAGVDIGSTGNFYAAFGPLAGVHFSLPNLREIGVSLDGGAFFSITTVGNALGSTTNFSFGLHPLSPALGLSIHYFL